MKINRQLAPGVVLLLETDPAISDGAIMLLSIYGFQVRWVPNTAALWACLELEPALCLVCEEFLPDSTGIEIFCELRQREIILPFALLVSGGDRRAVSNATQKGIKHIIRKPLVHAQLLNFVEQSLQWQAAGPSGHHPR